MARRFGKFTEVHELKPREGAERNLYDREFEDVNKVGFDDFYYEPQPEIQALSDRILSSQNKAEVKQEFIQKNRTVEKEIQEYYDDTVTEASLRMYLTKNITNIYGEALQEANSSISPSELVDSFLAYNEFNGVQSYRDFCSNIEEILLLTRERERVSGRASIANKISNKEVESISAGYRNLKAEGDISANAYIGRKAKEFGVDKKELLNHIRENEKSQINCKGKTLHYHRTSIERAKDILQCGEFLNRDNLRERGYDVSKFSGSSSNDVQFSVDKYSQDGQLLSAGFDARANLGASSSDIVFVMGPRLIDEKSYDCFGMYPTVETASIENCCVAILAKDEKTLEALDTILEETDIVVPTMLQKEFDRAAFAQATENIAQMDMGFER